MSALKRFMNGYSLGEQLTAEVKRQQSESIRYAYEEVKADGQIRAGGILVVCPIYFSVYGSSRGKRSRPPPKYTVEQKHHKLGWCAVPKLEFDSHFNAQAWVDRFGGRVRRHG